MNKLSGFCVKKIRSAIFEYGRDWQRDQWYKHLENAPRYEPDPNLNPCPAPNPWPDDGQSPIPEDLRLALLGCLHLCLGHMMEKVGNPSFNEDYPDSNDIADIDGLIKWIEKW